MNRVVDFLCCAFFHNEHITANLVKIPAENEPRSVAELKPTQKLKPLLILCVNHQSKDVNYANITGCRKIIGFLINLLNI